MDDEEILGVLAMKPTENVTQICSNYSMLYWSLLNELLKGIPVEIWGKLVVMEYNRCVLEVDLDVVGCRQVTVAPRGADGSSPSGQEPATSTGVLDIAPLLPPPQDGAATTAAMSGVHVCYSPGNGVFVMMPHANTPLYLCHLVDTPHATAYPLPTNKPCAAFNAGLFDTLCSGFHSGLATYPHVDHFTAKLLLQMCVFSVSPGVGGGDPLSAPFWFLVVNVEAARRVLAERVMHHIVRQEFIRCQYSLAMRHRSTLRRAITARLYRDLENTST